MPKTFTFTQALPYKSVAGALWLALLFGPVGLLYSTLVGGIIMIVVGLLVLATIPLFHANVFLPFALLWIISIIFSVGAVGSYNKRLFMLVMEANDN